MSMNKDMYPLMSTLYKLKIKTDVKSINNWNKIIEKNAKEKGLETSEVISNIIDKLCKLSEFNNKRLLNETYKFVANTCMNEEKYLDINEFLNSIIKKAGNSNV